MSTTSPSPQGSLVAPMLVLLGPVFALGASFVASDGVPQQLVHEAGMLAFVATAVCFVVTFIVAGLLFVASRGRSWAAVVALPLALLPWAVMALAMVLGADLVASAVRSADPSAGFTLLAMGSSEVMASRMLGASFAFGSALALTLAMLVLALAEPVEGRSRVPGSAYTVLLLVVVTGTAFAALADATVLRHGLAAMSSLDFEARVAVLSQTLDDAYDSHEGLVGAVGFTLFTGVGLLVVALRAASGGALLVAVTTLVGTVFGVTDVALSYYVAATLEVETPWESEFGFEPLALDSRGGAAGTVACLATREQVRCGAGAAGYDGLDGVLPRATSGASLDRALPSGISLAGVPALSVAIDAGLSARELRLLLEAAVRAGYRSLTVVGGVMLPAFRELEDSEDAEIPPLLVAYAVVTPTTSWLLVASGGDHDMAPVVIEVRDDDTAGSVAARAGQTTDQSVLVLAAPPPTVAAPAPPTDADGVGLLGANPSPDAEPGALDSFMISRVIRSHAATVRACFDRGLRTDPNLGGRVMIRFTITPAGAVSDVTSSSTLSSEPVLRCMEDAVGSIVFPADPTREPVTVNFPFVFSGSP